MFRPESWTGLAGESLARTPNSPRRAPTSPRAPARRQRGPTPPCGRRSWPASTRLPDGVGAQPERSSSRRRRSRLVGRPVPGSRRNTGIHSCFGGGGGLWSTRHSAANRADTRLLMRATTSKIRSRWWARAVTRSPTWTLAAGLTGAPLTHRRFRGHTSPQDTVVGG